MDVTTLIIIAQKLRSSDKKDHRQVQKLSLKEALDPWNEGDKKLTGNINISAPKYCKIYYHFLCKTVLPINEQFFLYKYKHDINKRKFICN